MRLGLQTRAHPINRVVLPEANAGQTRRGLPPTRIESYAVATVASRSCVTRVTIKQIRISIGCVHRGLLSVRDHRRPLKLTRLEAVNFALIGGSLDADDDFHRSPQQKGTLQ